LFLPFLIGNPRQARKVESENKAVASSRFGAFAISSIARYDSEVR
jgi:hypothetical protein